MKIAYLSRRVCPLCLSAQLYLAIFPLILGRPFKEGCWMVTTMTETAEVVIIGSGFAGLGMAIQLRRTGKDSFVVLEVGK